MSDALLDEVDPDALTEQVMAAQPSSAPPDYILDCAKVIAEYDPVLRSMNPPCKLTPTTAVTLLMTIRAGAHYETACAKARISYSAFVAWRNRAEDDDSDGPWATLQQSIKLAEADAELESLSDVRVAAKNPKFWAAGMTFLERRHPDRWKRPDATAAVSVQVGIAVGMPGQALSAPARQIANENAMCPPLSIEVAAPVAAPALAPSPVPETAIPLSPPPKIPVTVAQRKAKATPKRGVSPRNVA